METELDPRLRFYLEHKNLIDEWLELPKLEHETADRFFKEAEGHLRDGMLGWTGDPELFSNVEDYYRRLLLHRPDWGEDSDDPIIGVGFGQYGPTIFRKGIDYKPRSAHSSIIEIGIEEGIIGLMFYFAILIVIYRNASRVYKETTDPLDKALSLGLLGATVTLLFLDLTGTRFRSSNIMAFYWILTGLTLNVWPTLKRASDHAQSSWRQRIVTAPAAK